MNWGKWNLEVHNDLNQLKRIVSGTKISDSKVQLNPNESAIILGSSPDPYIVTLNSCTCYDFESRQLPCKHIYRLALELNKLSDLPKLNSKLSKEFNKKIPDEISNYYDEYLSGAISCEKFIKIAEALQKGK